MKRYFVLIEPLMLAVSCIFLVFACQQETAMTPVTDKSAILGKWGASGETVEIFEDGKIVHTDKLKKETNGKYEFIDNNIIRIVYEG